MGNRVASPQDKLLEGDGELYHVVLIGCHEKSSFVHAALKKGLVEDTTSSKQVKVYRRRVVVKGRKIIVTVSCPQFHDDIEKNQEIFVGGNAVVLSSDTPSWKNHMEAIGNMSYVPTVRLLVGKNPLGEDDVPEHNFCFHRINDSIDGVLKVIIHTTLDLLLMGQNTKGAKR
mmetsp:Transcript_37454/g.59042  ORF Transcript_37454/g.59042 Transcript_37454/m.59042 type:complete len:172 (-) Transcript_37454:153-668(-)|eukprot:CAMPEP_0201528280 /NCGR_PEP_ID=MMETSP0161_2-20130828/37835_1 /ASSEMBLY_ACC=CAM_ASM_000251 /TAXON_ID=180227 /ORGANISM="Neoparamoeba aestuarina, Strain SoJaBio B1-5/56/2" /LENGTH=171 /DNA_ID=CAMNT_0047929487 /DNA_START=97 /DNA_END=612 /DNA_ORIENTATION=-